MLEEFSTAPCGFCPEGGIIAQQLIGKYPNLFTFTHHAGFGRDSMTIFASDTIAKKYVTFAPAGVIDRGNYPIDVYTKPGFIGISRQKWDSIIAIRLNEPSQVKVSLTQSFDYSTRKLNVTVKAQFIQQVYANDYRINIAIVEDSVSGIGKGWDQKNYFNNDSRYPDLYHKGDSIVGYQHRHVLRALPFGTWGMEEIIPLVPEVPEVNTIYMCNLSNFTIPDRWKLKDITLYAFVSVYNDSNVWESILNTDEQKLNFTPSEVEETTITPQTLNLAVYPNPVSDLAYVECNFPETTKANFALFSSTGEKIRDIKSDVFLGKNNVYFYASDLATGLYFIKMTYNCGVICKKFLVNR